MTNVLMSDEENYYYCLDLRYPERIYVVTFPQMDEQLLKQVAFCICLINVINMQIRILIQSYYECSASNFIT